MAILNMRFEMRRVGSTAPARQPRIGIRSMQRLSCAWCAVVMCTFKARRPPLIQSENGRHVSESGYHRSGRFSMAAEQPFRGNATPRRTALPRRQTRRRRWRRRGRSEEGVVFGAVEGEGDGGGHLGVPRQRQRAQLRFGQVPRENRFFQGGPERGRLAGEVRFHLGRRISPPTRRARAPHKSRSKRFFLKKY